MATVTLVLLLAAVDCASARARWASRSDHQLAPRGSERGPRRWENQPRWTRGSNSRQPRTAKSKINHGAPPRSTNVSGTSHHTAVDEHPLTVAILSDSYDALVVCVGSLLRHTKRAINVWIFGSDIEGTGGGAAKRKTADRWDEESKACMFGCTSGLRRRLGASLQLSHRQTVSVMSLHEATEQLLAVGIKPVWTWPEFETSVGERLELWSSNLTLQPDDWDYADTHRNMLRYYLPHVKPFRNKDSLFFVEDDVVVQRDLGALDVPMGVGVTLAAPCSGWELEKQCSRAVPFDAASNWRVRQNALYLHTVRPDCAAHGYADDGGASAAPGTSAGVGLGGGGGRAMHALLKGRARLVVGERQPRANPECRGAAYEETVQELAREVLGYPVKMETQKIWSFGLVRANLSEWRARDLTGVLQRLLKGNYERRVWPETSLAFGLGVAYLTFSDRVACWQSLTAEAIEEGLGWVRLADMEAAHAGDARHNVTARLADALALHWSGHEKPWSDASRGRMDAELAAPFVRERSALGLPAPPPPSAPERVVRALLYTDPHSGADWLLQLLDAHPEVCAPGASPAAARGFARESLMPPRPQTADDASDCGMQSSCRWAFVARWAPHYAQHHAAWCQHDGVAAARGRAFALRLFTDAGSRLKGDAAPALDEPNATAPHAELSRPPAHVHATFGERLCRWVGELQRRHPRQRTLFTSEGVQRLWDLYEAHAFAQKSQLLPCADGCRGKRVRLFKFLREWAAADAPLTPAPNGSDGAEAALLPHFRRVEAPRNAPVLGPVLRWTSYRVVELRRWNVFEMCAGAQVARAAGARLAAAAPPVVSVDVPALTSCVRNTLQTRRGDTAATPAENWLRLSYEYCAEPHNTPACVSLAARHLGASSAAEEGGAAPPPKDDPAREGAPAAPRDALSELANADEAAAAMVRGGFAVFLKPIFYLELSDAAAGPEIRAVFAQLPRRFVLPGSSEASPFSEAGFRAGALEADARPHALVAFERSDRPGGAARLVGLLRGRTRRPVVVLSCVRGVVQHRTAHYLSARTKGGREASLARWVRAQTYPTDLQMEGLFALRAGWRAMPWARVWDELSAGVLPSNGTELGAGVLPSNSTAAPAVRTLFGPIGVFGRAKATLCVMAAVTGMPIPWQRHRADASDWQRPDADETAALLQSLDEETLAKIEKREARELYFISRAKETFEHLTGFYRCGENDEPPERIPAGESEDPAWQSTQAALRAL